MGLRVRWEGPEVVPNGSSRGVASRQPGAAQRGAGGLSRQIYTTTLEPLQSWKVCTWPSQPSDSFASSPTSPPFASASASPVSQRGRVQIHRRSVNTAPAEPEPGQVRTAAARQHCIARASQVQSVRAKHVLACGAGVAEAADGDRVNRCRRALCRGVVAPSSSPITLPSGFDGWVTLGAEGSWAEDWAVGFVRLI